MVMSPRNLLLSRWDLLFDRKTPGWISFRPRLGLHVYPCYACRDMFASKNSFLDHVNRRGMLLKYRCHPCSQGKDVMVFYNPCSFLLHAREHCTSSSGGQINLENLEVASVPWGLGGFLPEPTIPLLYNVEDDDNLEEAAFVDSRFYSALTESRGESVVKLIPNELFFFYSSEENEVSTSLVLKQVARNIPRCRFVNLDSDRLTAAPDATTTGEVQVKEEPDSDCGPVITKIETVRETNPGQRVQNYGQCPECGEVQTMSMGEHFLKTNKPFQESLKCSTCKYIAPTCCSLEAHQRIHDSVAPYVCPECGKTFDNCKLLHAHLEEVCFHLTKQVRFRCPGKKCGKIFAQTGTFSAHFAVHTPSVHKCAVCSRVFPDQAQFLDHATVHEDKIPPVKMFTCTVCPELTEISAGRDFQEHVLGHAVDRKQFLYVYICKHCHSYFRSTLTYATHLLRCAKLASHAATPPLLARKEPSPTSDANKKKYKLGAQVSLTCSTCKAPVELQNTHSSTSICCATCQRVTEESHTGSPSTDLRLDKTYCLLCKRRLTAQEMESHFRSKQCKFHSPVVLLESKVNPRRKTEISPRSEDINSKRKRKKAGTTTASKTRKLSVSISEPEPCLDPEEPTHFDGTYRCRLCKYASAEREVFHRHIMGHRDVCTAYQCMECGECFVVKPSLMKHLLYYHQITDIETYFEENQCFDRQAVKELGDVMRLAPGESKEPVAENQCRVCLERFSNGSELNKHFRTHGMAFLLKNSK